MSLFDNINLILSFGYRYMYVCNKGCKKERKMDILKTSRVSGANFSSSFLNEKQRMKAPSPLALSFFNME